MRLNKLVAAAGAATLSLAVLSPVATAQSVSGSSLDEAFGLSSQLADVLGQLTSSTGSTGVGGTNTTESVNVAGQGNRSYILQLPEGFDPAKSYDLVFGFGGMDHEAPRAQEIIRLSEAANGEAIVVYPQPTFQNGHFGWEGPRYGGARGKDVAFVRAISDSLHARYNIDSTYATGLSNGGGMAMNLACQAPDLVDAVAGVATANYGPIYTGCSGSVPTLFLHGTEDTTAPYYVSGSNPHGGTYLSVLQAFRAVGERNGCDINSKSIESRGSFNAEQMQGCAADTVLYTVPGGEHTWFPNNPTATREVWDFLNSH